MSPHGWFCSQVPQRMYLCLLLHQKTCLINEDVPTWMVLLASPPKDVFMFAKKSAILQANNIKDVPDWIVV